MTTDFLEIGKLYLFKKLKAMNVNGGMYDMFLWEEGEQRQIRVESFHRLLFLGTFADVVKPPPGAWLSEELEDPVFLLGEKLVTGDEVLRLRPHEFLEQARE